MALIGFQKQFAGAVLKGLYPTEAEMQVYIAGEARRRGISLADLPWMVEGWRGSQPKRMTIRTARKVPIKVYETLHLYTGLRTRNCYKLGEVTCLACIPILISCEAGIRLGGDHWTWDTDPARELAEQDGFFDAWHMRSWVQQHHAGTLIGYIHSW